MGEKPKGRLFYIIGASGAGKDSLIHAVCTRAAEQDELVIAPRYITRPSSPLDRHIELTPSQFSDRQAAGEFLFSWSAHDFDYAVGKEICNWVRAGRRVLIDGSRAYLEQARRIYPDLEVIGIEADPDCLATRLRQRGREDEVAIAERLQRNQNYQTALEAVECRIENNRGIEQAASAMLKIIRAA